LYRRSSPTMSNRVWLINYAGPLTAWSWTLRKAVRGEVRESTGGFLTLRTALWPRSRQHSGWLANLVISIPPISGGSKH